MLCRRVTTARARGRRTSRSAHALPSLLGFGHRLTLLLKFSKRCVGNRCNHRVMDGRDEDLMVPDECVRWCRVQDHGVTVLDDMTGVDLDWWNTRLARREIPVQIAGFNQDGRQVDSGKAYLRRGDLQPGASTLNLQGSPRLNALYLSAAWLFAHRDRDRARRFVDVRNWRTPDQPLHLIANSLEAFERSPALIDLGPYRQWSGWPKAPGAGPSLLSLYCWTIHADSSHRPQLLDHQAVASLVHLGWLENPSVPQFTVARYTRYCDLLHHWAQQAGTSAELIEMWLVHQWRNRNATASHRNDRHTIT